MLLGVAAIRADAKLRWNAGDLTFGENVDANRLIKPAFRGDWTL